MENEKLKEFYNHVGGKASTGNRDHDEIADELVRVVGLEHETAVRVIHAMEALSARKQQQQQELASRVQYRMEIQLTDRQRSQIDELAEEYERRHREIVESPIGY